VLGRTRLTRLHAFNRLNVSGTTGLLHPAAQRLHLIIAEPHRRIQPTSSHTLPFAYPTALTLQSCTRLKKLYANQTLSLLILKKSLLRCLIWAVGERPMAEQGPAALFLSHLAPRLD
jgi:hypothetical protein